MRVKITWLWLTIPEDNKQIYTLKYRTYLTGEEELQKEISAEHKALESN